MAGSSTRMPAYAFVFMCLMLASVGLPGTSGFVGEFLILLGTFRVSTLECFLAATALFLGAMYMLYLYRRVIFGTITRDRRPRACSTSARARRSVFAPLLLLVLWMGIYPELVPDADPRLGRHLVAAGQRRAESRPHRRRRARSSSRRRPGSRSSSDSQG